MGERNYSQPMVNVPDDKIAVWLRGHKELAEGLSDLTAEEAAQVMTFAWTLRSQRISESPRTLPPSNPT